MEKKKKKTNSSFLEKITLNTRRSSYYKEKPTQAWNPHLGFSWHGVLRGSADLWAFTLHGEAGSGAQRVLHRHASWNPLSDSCHQLHGGQRSRR